MATWKKVIVSGSNASLNQVSASGGINAILSAISQSNFVAYDSASGTFSYASTGSFTAATASFITASNVYGPYGSNSILSASFAVTAAFANNVPATASYALQALSASYASNADLLDGKDSSIFATTSSNSFNGNQNITGSVNISGSVTATGFTGPLTGTASYANNASTADNASTASFVLNAVSSSFATNASTASFVLNAVSSSFATNASTASFVLNAVSSSFATNASTASFVLNAVSASFATSALSASYAGVAGNANSISNAITNNTNNFLLTALGSGSINGESNLTFDGSLLTVNGNTTITGDLSVAGTASFTNVDNLNIKDKFILINSGSATLADSGWVTQYNAAGSGSAFYLEATSTGTYGRFAMAYDAIGTSTSLTPDEFVVSAKITGSIPPANPTWGGSTNGSGNIHIDSGNGDIYIYA